LFGAAKNGKSFVAISIACAVMAGVPWCGFSTRKLRVLYVGAEGFFGLLRREAAWSKRATEDMSKVFDLIDMFRRELKEPTFIVVHHGTKDGLTYRGSSAIAANVDGAIEVSKDGLTLTLKLPDRDEGRG